MQKLTSLKLILAAGLFASTTSFAYIAVPPSLFQDAGNLGYVSIGGGVAREHSGSWSGSQNYASPNDPNDTKSYAGIGTAAIGYAFKDYPFRIELAYNFVGIGQFSWDSLEPPITGTANSAKAKVYSNIGLFNIYGDLPIGEKWIPFIKLGAGYGMNEAKLEYTNEENGYEYTSENHSNNNFVWNAGVGVNYAVSETVSIGAEVTYLYLGKAYVDAVIPATDTTAEYQESYAELDSLTALAATLNIAYHF